MIGHGEQGRWTLTLEYAKEDSPSDIPSARSSPSSTDVLIC
jgi:hypothetical protein